MSAISEEIDRRQSRLKQRRNENVEHFAARLYEAQMEVYAGWAASIDDLAMDRLQGRPFRQLDEKTRQGWIERAKQHKTQ